MNYFVNKGYYLQMDWFLVRWSDLHSHQFPGKVFTTTTQIWGGNSFMMWVVKLDEYCCFSTQILYEYLKILWKIPFKKCFLWSLAYNYFIVWSVYTFLCWFALCVEEKRRRERKGNGVPIRFPTGVVLCYNVAVIQYPIPPYFKYPSWSCQRHPNKSLQTNCK